MVVYATIGEIPDAVTAVAAVAEAAAMAEARLTSAGGPPPPSR